MKTKFPMNGVRYAIGTGLEAGARLARRQANMKKLAAMTILNQLDPVQDSPLDQGLSQIVWVLKAMDKVADERVKSCDGFASQLTGSGDELVEWEVFTASMEFEAASAKFSLLHTHLQELADEVEALPGIDLPTWERLRLICSDWD